MEAPEVYNREDNDPPESDPYENDPLTQQMRVATRKIHRLSDSLVNAKLGLAMTDDSTWANGLLLFYDIFKFLEEAMASGKQYYFKQLYAVISKHSRTAAFEKDIEHYFGNEYLKTHEPSEAVTNYLRHLRRLRERQPLRLVAYIYHLYMGLLSGGQIIKKKRQIRNKVYFFKKSYVDNVTNFVFEDNSTFSDLKNKIKFVINELALDFTDDERNSLLDESVEVFKNNNTLIRSVDNIGRKAVMAVVKSPLFVVAICLIAILVYYLLS